MARAEHQPDYCPMCQAPDPRRVGRVNLMRSQSNREEIVDLDEWECHTDGDEGRQGCGYRFWTEAREGA